MRIHPALIAALVATAPTLAHAQWSASSGANLSVADGASDQTQPKLAPTPDGGVYLSWFDGFASGFDVRLQKLDALGNEVWAHNGVLVLDRGFSSTQDYGLATDAAGNALLVFRDDTGVGTQITAAKVTPAGALAWGASGVQLTATAAFVAAPKIAGTTDGGAVVAWSQGSSVGVQKLDSAGVAQWAPPTVLTPGAGSYTVSDLHGEGTGAILAIAHQTGGFGSPRHLIAQRFDGAGAELWTAGGLAVFDGGSLQFGNTPSFNRDGSGGAVFSWYSTNAGLDVHAQHVLANGTEAFPHNGSLASTNAAQVHVSPSAEYDAATGHTLVAWTEQNAGQSQSGVNAQKFDAVGARLWGAGGVVVEALGASSVSVALPRTTGADEDHWWILWSSGQSVRAAQLDASGTVATGPTTLSSAASSKSRIVAARSAHGFSIAAWVDDRVDAGDVYAQNVHCNGALGTDPATSYCTAGTSANGCQALLSSAGSPSASAATGFDVLASSVEGAKNGIYFFGTNGQQANSWGTGTSFQCVTPPVMRAGLLTGTGTPGLCDGAFSQDFNARWTAKPNQNPGAGAVVQAQLWYRDPANTSNQTTSLSNAIEFTVCP